MPQWVYGFGGGAAEGRAEMRNLLGGKGAGLAEMCSLGLPVPPGFTITHRGLHAVFTKTAIPTRPTSRIRSPAASSRSSARSAPALATPTIRCWSGCGRVPACRCRA